MNTLTKRDLCNNNQKRKISKLSSQHYEKTKKMTDGLSYQFP